LRSSDGSPSELVGNFGEKKAAVILTGGLAERIPNVPVARRVHLGVRERREIVARVLTRLWAFPYLRTDWVQNLNRERFDRFHVIG
jgi:hypothetical protein